MRGKILDFSIVTNEGLISGDDGSRYRFSGPDWKTHGTLPIPGIRVDFVASGDLAREIYVDRPAGYPEVVDDLDEGYQGLYCSSDDKVVLGLCGGLAHKFNVPVAAMRFLVFFIVVWVVFLPYFVGLFLPKLPTKNVAHPR